MTTEPLPCRRCGRQPDVRLIGADFCKVSCRDGTEYSVVSVRGPRAQRDAVVAWNAIMRDATTVSEADLRAMQEAYAAARRVAQAWEGACDASKSLKEEWMRARAVLDRAIARLGRAVGMRVTVEAADVEEPKGGMGE